MWYNMCWRTIDSINGITIIRCSKCTWKRLQKHKSRQYIDNRWENCTCMWAPHLQLHSKTRSRGLKNCMVQLCRKAMGGRGGSAEEIILGFCPKTCARRPDQGLREEWCYPVAVSQPWAPPTWPFWQPLQPAALKPQPSTSIRRC